MKLSKKIIFILFIFVTSCSITSNVVKEPYSEIKVYFCPRDKCLEKIINLIDSSTEIKCAFFDLDIPELIEKLKEKNVEVVIEDKNALEEFSTGYSSALMHNKFCIFDKKIIMTGSMNPTERGNYYNNNNIVIIKSDHLAENYLDEFEELNNNIYGQGKNVKFPEILYGNLKIENYFCPEDNCKLRVINALKNAENSIYFMTYSFTDEDIGNLLYNKNYLGLDVKGILEKRQISKYSRYNDLKDFSIIDKNKYTMHHKVFIIDNKTVITGSYNPSKNANERNDENILIIYDKNIAQKYIEEFEYLWNIDYESIPEKISDLIISKVVPNPEGSDKDNEYFELYNKADYEIDLNYYFVSDNKTNSRLDGKIKQKESLLIRPKFSMKNKKGILILKKNMLPIDFIAWNGHWDLNIEEGDELIRKNKSKISSEAWIVE
jgi:phosphatidylserine/phosphatidylglycerophosphate/cardiolipin synthase-like enzyme